MLEFIEAVDTTVYEDFVYIFDSSSTSEPKLLRIISTSLWSPRAGIKTMTNSVQIVFKDHDLGIVSLGMRGFFIRATFARKKRKSLVFEKLKSVLR